MNGIRRRVKGLCVRLGWRLIRTGARLVGLRLPVGLVEIRPVQCDQCGGLRIPGLIRAPATAVQAAYRACMN